MFDLENYEIYIIVNLSAFILGLLFVQLHKKTSFVLVVR